MNNSRRGKRSRSPIVIAAAVGGVTAAVTVIGLGTLTGPDSLSRACLEFLEMGSPPWRVVIGPQSVSESDPAPPPRCIVMFEPVLADSESAVPTVAPGLLNDDEVFDALKTSIPGESGEMGTEGIAVAHFLVDETGAVQEQRIAESSGRPALEEALLAIGPLASFSPAETEEGPTEAWVVMTVGFITSQSALQRLRETLERWRSEAEI
ncbi:MAG: energy transducer TonB [Gemmatimonadetes bacterium]|nr:energy transducer TonB [Gemmatimonadota bacterium]MYB98236.1 energy transducer TonB [Gemmatimonadota bacterium]MYH51355.1 energy transducer TonB [Gemmatimonadota bacterium]MYK65386.1 energy transducer TonB [Gemmatimonadota bacterium]